MEKILKLYTYVDGTNDTPFPSADEQVIIGSFTYTANRMGSAPQITATVKHRLCLDDIWNDKVYAEFNGEKYFVINTPSSSKSNDDTRYEHDLELLSEREILNHVYFIDAVQGDSDTDVYKSNSTKVLFYGDIQQFVARLNASLSYRNLGYTAVIDDGVTSEDKQVSFEDKYILEALQEEFNIFEIPYYFVGKVIHFGYTSNAITTTFKYGHDDAFLSISKDNANYALINRITGVGSSDNIPYYYPNETDDQSAVEASGKKWITPSQNLMPSIYRESEGAEMFYEAKNNTYPDGEGGYYQFENEYSDTNPREGKTDFEDIKPTITGITNAAGQRIDMFSEFAYDTNDNDEVDEEGNYLHPYFFAKLRKTDGTYGFNLFDHAIESQTMQITFTSGICGACTFEIAVGEDTQKNLVQVGETSSALMRDEDGNVLCGREDLQQPQTPQDRQNDTQNYEVWIALRKDNSTYPQVMPNVNYNYKPSTSDTFAILGISLPQAYILKAEDELEKSLVKHMWMNNVEKFTFSAKFSRIFFTEHPEVLAQLNENARVLIEYNGKQHTLYIDNYTYKMDSGSPLPEIDIDLVDTLSVGKNSLQTQLDSVKQDILSSIGGGDFLKQGLKYFLRKDTSDTARGKITFVRGLDVGTFAENTSGGTFRILEDLTTYAEVDRLRVRVKAYFEALEIINTNSVGGKMILTAGGGVYLREVKDRETLEDGTEQVWDFYRCYFLTEQDGREVENRFHVGDLAMSQSFNIKAGTHQGVTNHYYWREVVGIGDDYIDLSKTICDTGSDAPMAEDTVCHLGNRSDKDRQGAIIFSAVDVFSPSITLYYGINDFSLVNKDYVSYGVDKSTGNAFFRVYGEMYAGDREQTSYIKYTPGYGVTMRGTFLNTAGDNYDDLLNALQNSVDGNIETWFGEEEPTLTNEPAVNWTTDEDKNTHLGDLYYSDAGVAYRFQMEGAQYVWKMLKDSDITKALADAKAAKDAADAAQEAADAAADRLTAWASDGVISPTEKQGIKDEIARIDADKANITAQYTKYGLGTPTSFNNAYTAYRAVLVSLSASTPENIAIPSDFSSKQTYYYNERTSALGAIADASITSVNNVTEQLEQMQQDFAEVKEDVAGVKTSVDGLKNFTDEAFADGIVDRNESAAIASHINSIETFAKDAAESYTKVYENALLTGTAKTNLANAYTAFTAAKTELVTTINGAIADGLVDALEKSAVDGKYTAFNTKYGDFVANLNAANRAIQDAINQKATQALEQIAQFDYLKAAMQEDTLIKQGLVLTSLISLGYTTEEGRVTMAGTNGIYDASKLGGGIASWWGGAMFDRFEYTEETMPENVASALVRMDGTGYFAKGNLWWESDGTLHADPLSFFVGEDSVGDVLGLFQFVKSDAGIEYVIPQYPFQKLEIGNYLQIGKAQLYWDEANQAFYVRHQDGVSPVGFYATGFISAKGANPDAGGTVSGASSLDGLTDVTLTNPQNGQVLAYNGSQWVNKTLEAGLDETVLAQYLTDNLYVTQTWVNSQNYATEADLDARIDALVNGAPAAFDTLKEIADVLQGNVDSIGDILTALGNKADKTITITAGTGLTGGGNLSANRTLSLATVGTAGTYTKVTVDAYGRVTGHASLATTDIPNLPWSKITSGKPTTLGGYGITDGVNAVSVTGSGNAVTTANVSGHTLTLTKGSTFALTTGTNASGTWPISISGNAAQLGGLTWGNFNIVRRYYLNLSSLPTTNFYPVTFPQSHDELDCEIHSPDRGGDSAFNQNRIHFMLTSRGWTDTGTSLLIISRNNYTDTETTIGAIGVGTKNGTNAVWLRGGMNYEMYVNRTPTLHTSTYTNGSGENAEIFTVGTNLCGGSNTNVSIIWQNTASTYNHYTAVTNNSNPYFNPSVKIGSGTISWDSTNNCFHFSHGLYSDSFVSAKGANSGSGGTVSGVTKLSDLSDVQLGTLATNQVLSWNGSKWVNKAISTGLDETALAQYLTNNQYLTMPTGDGRYALKAGTNATGTWPISISGQAMTLGNNPTGLSNATYGTYGGFLQGSSIGPTSGIWYNIIKILHGNTAGYYTELAQSFTGTEGLWHRRMYNGSVSAWKTILDSSNYVSTLDTRYVKKAGDTMTGALTVPSLVVSGSTATVSGNKVWHAGNDGSGSGLDADLLDGLQYTSFESYRVVQINASSLNQNTWYPVTMSIGNSLQTRIRIEGNTSANASWNPRADKYMSLILDYTVNGSQWGWTGAQRVIYQYMEGSGTSSCLGGLGQLTNSSIEYVFVRGGAVYNFYVSRFITPVLRTSTFTVMEQSVSPTTTAPAAISRTNALITDNVYSATQLQTARTINDTAFNGTSNIVTSYWGTARTLSLTGNATGSVSMNGSANVSMSVNVNYATSAGNADTLDGVHNGNVTAIRLNGVYTGRGGMQQPSYFAGRGKGIFLNMMNKPVEYSDVIYIDAYGGMDVPYVNAIAFQKTSSAHGTVYHARAAHNGSSWGTWYPFIDSYNIGSYNAGSATRLQTERTIWGRPFDGTAPVSGNMTEVGDISFNGSNRLYWKENGDQFAIVPYFSGTNDSNILQFQSAVGAAGTTPALTTKMVIAGSTGNVGIGTTSPSYKLHVAGDIYATSWLRTNGQTGWYSETYGGGWYMSDTNYIRAYNNKNIRTSGLISAGEYQDDAYGYFNCTRPNTSGTFCCYAFVRSGNFAFGLGYNSSNQIVLGSSTRSKGINPWIYITPSGTYTDGYLSAKGQNSSSDIRLKNILCPVRPSLEAFAKAPLFKFAWKSNPDMVEIGSSAQYWRNVLPDTVKERDGWLEMGYGNIALAGVITIARDFETLEQRVDRLEKENYKLKKRIKDLERRTRE